MGFLNKIRKQRPSDEAAPQEEAVTKPPLAWQEKETKAVAVEAPSSEDTVFEDDGQDPFALLSSGKEPSKNRGFRDELELLGVEATFVIPSDVFMADDLDNLVFDSIAPVGYDPDQVKAFVRQVKHSVAHYVALLKRRNEDVATLGTMIDKLKVSLNNQHFNAELSNGITIATSQDNEILEAKYSEALVTIHRLEEEVARLKTHASSDDLTNKERERYLQLLDEVSLLQRAKEEEEARNRELVHALNALEEEKELAHGFAPQEQASPDADDEPLPLLFEEESLPSPAPEDDSLPLPPLDEEPRRASPAASPSAFASDEQDPFAFYHGEGSPSS